MKKVFAAIAIVAIIAIMSVSCGAGKTCPAYSLDNTEQTDGNNG